ncbi:MAG TPA: class I SAM-dependent methyltransferase [Baekduia sp.]
MAPEALKRARSRWHALQAEIEDTRALQALAPLSTAFLPWTTFSMRPAAILAIMTDLTFRSSATIVECGSGNSTVFAARLLKAYGIPGHVHSLDHDEHWANLTRRALGREQLEDVATVIHAPLADGWYDQAMLPAVAGIDVLVVDGPPAHDRARARSREPALDRFRDQLAAGASIFLDDSHRSGEQQVVASWARRHGIRLEQRSGGFATARLA